MRLDAASAIPSTRPRDSAPVFSTEMKKAGNIDATISEEKSLKKLVSPRKKTVRGRSRILLFTSITRIVHEDRQQSPSRARDEPISFRRSNKVILFSVCRQFPTSPKATSIPSCTLVDAAFALDEVTQRPIQILEFSRVPQHTGPFAPGPIIDLCVICGTIILPVGRCTCGGTTR